MSNALTTQTKSLLDKMLLFNIKLVTHAIVGRIKDRLNELVSLYIFYISACTKKNHIRCENTITPWLYAEVVDEVLLKGMKKSVYTSRKKKQKKSTE